MLITVCTDDDNLIYTAQQQSRTQPRIFGRCYRGFEDTFPQLRVDENLFVVAHGAFDTDDVSPRQPVIGDQEHALYLTGGELYANLKDILPEGYTGGIYISACYSAHPGGPAALSFGERLSIELARNGLGHIPVYGHEGTVRGFVPPPGDPGWVRTKAA